MNHAHAKTPVTLLVGFLGGGKTTLARHILTGNHGLNIAVIVNEFGELGIDALRIQGSGDGPVIEMNNGCICCSMRGSLVPALGDLYRSRQLGERNFDYVVIEASGMADPAPVMHNLMGDGPVGQGFMLDGVVTVIDAENYQTQLRVHRSLCQHQIMLGNVLLLNKADKVSAGAMEDLEQFVSGLNPHANKYRTIQSEIDVNRILNLHQGAVEQLLTIAPEQHNHDHDHDHGEGHHEHHHHSTVDFECVTIIVDGRDLHAERFNRWYGDLVLRFGGVNFPRSKGHISLTDVAGPVTLDSVCEQTYVRRLDDQWPADKPRTIRMEFHIRKGVIDPDVLRKGFYNCLVEA